MKKFILSALILIMVAGSADAQAKRNNGQKNKQFKSINRSAKMQPSQMKGQMYNQLNLSSYQRSQANRLNQNLVSNLQSMRSNNRLSQQQKKSTVNRMVQQHQSGFRSLLSPAQSQQYSSLLNTGTYNQFDLENSAASSMLGDYGWLLSLLGSNLNLGSLLGSNLDLGSLLGLFIK